MTFLSSVPSTSNNFGGGTEPECDDVPLLRAIGLSNFDSHLFRNLEQVLGVCCDFQLAILVFV